MTKLYQLIQSNRAKSFLVAKMAGVLLVLIIWTGFFGDWHDIKYRILLMALMASLFTTLFWGIIFSGRKFERQTARLLIYLDIVILFFLIFPIAYQNLFILVQAAILLFMINFLLDQQEGLTAGAVFIILFAVALTAFSLFGLIEKPVYIFASQGILFAIIFSASYTTRYFIDRLEKQQNKLLKDRQAFKNKYDSVERELLLNRQRMETLNKDVRKRDIEIKNILTLSGQINLRDDSRKALNSFLLTLIGQLGVAYVALLKRENQDHNFVSVFLHRGLRGFDLDKIRIYLDSNLIQILSSIQEPILVQQIPQDDLYQDEIQLLKHFSNDLFCPIFINNNMIGLYVIGHKISGQSFSKEDNNLISIIANQTAYVLEQAQLTNEYQLFYAKTLRAMLKALESKYVYARGHNVRTANYVNIIAKKFAIPPQEVKNLSYGALLHDIGKVAIKDEYLFNKEKFTADDHYYKHKILEHTLEGKKILKAAGFNDAIIDLATHHHEFYNGKGFPDRLGEDDLTLGARILAVCNAFDAMTSDRPHRRALPVATAKEYLQYYAGQQFDPEIVRIFLHEYESNDSMQRYH